ncbi:MBL fold metallo-hydrolase [Spirochaeta cellobiosiphila]|uniref:MBL fold metallo-hydrolase n=1 Tax=Spirochaeta cellobiosiphila TaxID=504483 RepID=UPI0003FE764A|nr:MBL fold metallo-hydrolase [Spirochaeta cellobiosiphila]
MKLKLWGVRGSIPVPGPSTVNYGGNTLCLELRFGKNDRLIIIDAGSGIRELAGDILKRDLPKGPIKTEIFITHTHWDHIMGFPFFTPIFVPGTQIDIYGPVTYEDDSLDTIIGGQLRYRYFPVKHSELSADIKYHPLKECEKDLGDGITLKTKYLNHPILCLGYRFEYEGKVICTVYDHEPFRNLFPTDPNHPDYDELAAEEGENAVKEENQKIRDFYKDADILIHDSQYTNKELLDSKLGWGHSSYEYAINSAHKSGVKKLVLIHHDPLRSDKELDELEQKYKKKIANKTKMEIVFAKEQMEFVL